MKDRPPECVPWRKLPEHIRRAGLPSSPDLQFYHDGRTWRAEWDESRDVTFRYWAWDDRTESWKEADG